MKASGIGGQALMEGVMMKNGSHYACAVRKPDGTIEIDDQRTTLLGEKYKFFNLPIIRGVVTFIESLKIGIKTLTWSAGFFEDEEEGESGKERADSGDGSTEKVKKAAKKEKTASEKRKEGLVMGLMIVLAVVFAVGLFMILPYFISTFLKKVISSTFLLALIEGVIRVSLFVGYVAAISLMKEIKRVFMYHGAEHKSINCVESGMELTVENVRKCSREHKRCGTSFLLIVMVMSIIFFLFIRFESTILMIVARLLLIPLIAGLSYEFIRLAGRTDNVVINFLSKPGLALQKLTTREPDDSMIECAIASVEAVFDWRAFQADVKAEEEAKKAEKRERQEKRQQEREDEIHRRMEAKGISEEDISEERIKEIDAEADRLAEKDIRKEELAEELAKEAAEKAKTFEKELKEEEKKQALEAERKEKEKKQTAESELKKEEKEVSEKNLKEAGQDTSKKEEKSPQKDKKKDDKKKDDLKKSDTKEEKKSEEKPEAKSGDKSKDADLNGDKSEEEKKKALERAIKNGYAPVAGQMDAPDEEDEGDEVLNALNKYFKK